MKKYKELIIIVLVLVVVGVGTYLLSKVDENKNFKEISYEDYVNLKESDEEVLIYTASSAHDEALNEVKNFAKENDLTFRYIYLENLTDEQKAELNLTEENVVIYNKNDQSEVFSGGFSTTEFRDFFVNLGMLDKEYITIGINDYVSRINEENFVVFIARDGCGYCDMFKPVVNEVLNDYDINIYLLDITNFTDSDYESMYATTSYFTEQQWGTPTTIIFNKGEVVDILGGYVEQADFEDFLKTNGVI